MNYNTFETSVEAGRPVEIYTILAGSTSFFYTSAPDEHTIAATTYRPVPGLKRSAYSEGPTKRDTDFQIEIPTENEVAQLFVGNQPGIRIRLTVKRFHRDDTPTPEVVQIFDGYVQSASFKLQAKKCILTARSVIASLGRVVPRRVYSSACNHVLYDPLTCQVDDTDPAFRAAVLNVDSLVGNVLTVVSGISGTYPDGFMAGGFVEAVGAADYRLILEHTGNVLTLLAPFSSTPSTVNVFAGCAHTIAVCKSKFDNVDRFGGFAFVPKKNPFATGIL